MIKLFTFRWGTSRAESGAVAVEASIALPLFITLLFMFQDLLVVGYNFIGIRHTLHEAIRVASLGPTCRLDGSYCPPPTLKEHLQAARDKAREVGMLVGVWDEYGFMHNEADLYTGQLDIEILREEDVMSNAAPEAQIADCETGIYGPTDANGNPITSKFCRVHMRLTKQIQLTPPSGLLLTLVGGDGTITITREDWAALER